LTGSFSNDKNIISVAELAANLTSLRLDWTRMASIRTAGRSDEQVIEKLDQVLKLLGMMAVKGLSQTDQIATLNRIGLFPKDIAEIVGTTSNTVRVALVSIRKSEAGGHKRKRSTTDE
jgi:hypothetical protein